jgi:MFS family permease
MTRVQWLICVVASIGFAFDIYEILMLPLILPPALQELGGIQLGTPQFDHWRDLMFYLPAICGGIFGLLGGYLTDRLGRRRVLVWSILLYAFSALAAGFSTSLPQLLLKAGIFFAGLLTVAQFSFWGNYLPRVYPTHLRGTGESFAANMGGRLLGASAPLLTSQLGQLMPGATPEVRLAYAAAGVALFVYALGLTLSFLPPEPARDLPE